MRVRLRSFALIAVLLAAALLPFSAPLNFAHAYTDSIWTNRLAGGYGNQQTQTPGTDCAGVQGCYTVITPQHLNDPIVFIIEWSGAGNISSVSSSMANFTLTAMTNGYQNVPTSMLGANSAQGTLGAQFAVYWGNATATTQFNLIANITVSGNMRLVVVDDATNNPAGLVAAGWLNDFSNNPSKSANYAQGYYFGSTLAANETFIAVSLAAYNWSSSSAGYITAGIGMATNVYNPLSNQTNPSESGNFGSAFVEFCSTYGASGNTSISLSETASYPYNSANFQYNTMNILMLWFGKATGGGGSTGLTLSADPTTTTGFTTFSWSYIGGKTVTNYNLTLGDGNALPTLMPAIYAATWTYHTNGTFNAVLNATFSDGTNMESNIVPITVSGALGESLSLIAYPNPSTTGFTLLSAQYAGPRLVNYYNFSFGDGAYANPTLSNAVPYIYPAVGNYPASVLAVFLDGTTLSASTLVTVSSTGVNDTQGQAGLSLVCSPTGLSDSAPTTTCSAYMNFPIGQQGNLYDLVNVRFYWGNGANTLVGDDGSPAFGSLASPVSQSYTYQPVNATYVVTAKARLSFLGIVDEYYWTNNVTVTMGVPGGGGAPTGTTGNYDGALSALVVIGAILGISFGGMILVDTRLGKGKTSPTVLIAIFMAVLNVAAFAFMFYTTDATGSSLLPASFAIPLILIDILIGYAMMKGGGGPVG